MQFKLAFIGDNDLPSVESDSKLASEHGFDGIEYNYWDNFRDLTAKTVAEMRKIHETHGLHASMFGLWGWNHLSPDKAARKEAHDMLSRAIDFARALKAEVLVTGAGDIPGEPVGRKVADFVKVMPPFMDKIRKAGMTPAFYAVHGATFLDSIEAFERVWEHVPDLKMKFDPANWDYHGDDYIDVVRRYGHKIGYIHIKEHVNHKGEKAASQPPAGFGDIQWGKLFAFLYEHNYKGYLSIEPHGPIWSKAPHREKMILLSKRYISQFLI